MSSYVILFCFFAAALVADAAVLTREGDEIVVGADAKQQLMRSESKAPDEEDNKEDKVKIELFYESKCPDCEQFINGSLRDFYANGPMENVNLILNPYGNSMSIPVANVSQGYKFFHSSTTGAGWDYVHISQHGAEEAFGNLVHACAMKKVEQAKYMKLILCAASHPEFGIEKASYECMQHADIDPKPITACVESPEGNHLMAELGKATAAVKGRKGTPWVLVNGEYLEDESQLLRTVCKSLSNAPDSCKSFQTADDKDKADAPSSSGSGDPDFIVLPVVKKSVKEELVQMAFNIPTKI